VFFIHVPCFLMCILFYFSFIWLHLHASASNSMVHCGRAFKPGASGLPYYCKPPVCVPDVIDALAMWRQNTPKKESPTQMREATNKKTKKNLGTYAQGLDTGVITDQLKSTITAIFLCVTLSCQKCSLLLICVCYCQPQKRRMIWIWVKLMYFEKTLSYLLCEYSITPPPLCVCLCANVCMCAYLHV